MEKLIRAGLRNPVLVSVKEKQQTEKSQKTPVNLQNYYLVCQPSQKFATLVAFINGLGDEEKAMVFFATCACVEYFKLVMERLYKNKRKIFSIHGKKTKRNEVFDAFRKADSGKE